MITVDSGLVPFARERLTVTNAVKTLTAATYTDAGSYGSTLQRAARAAKVTVIAQPLTYTEQGTDPVVGSVGTPVVATTEIFLASLDAIRKFKAIRTGGTDAEIEVVYYR